MRVEQPLMRRSAPQYPQRKNEPDKPLVIIVDDDEAVREGLHELILSAGFQPATFSSTKDLLEADVIDRPGCLILDVRMPGSSGLDLQHHLARNGNPKPIIFVTGHGDIPMTVQAMKAGAIDFLTKPVRDQTLLDAVIAVEQRPKWSSATSGVWRHLRRASARYSTKSRVGASTSRSPTISVSAR